jgi:hypothetical protein
LKDSKIPNSNFRSNRSIQTTQQSYIFELDRGNDETKTSATPFKMEDISMEFKIELLPDDPEIKQNNRLLIYSRVVCV